MISKILITVAVIVVVALVFRNKRGPEVQRTRTADNTAGSDDASGIKAQTVAYGVLALVILLGAWIAWEKYAEAHRVLQIQVTSPATGETVIYEAYQSDLKGKQFTTIDGREVTVGEAERMEVHGR